MPVADKNGTAMIIKMVPIRPSPNSAWYTPHPQYTRVQTYSMLPLKMLGVLPDEHRTRCLCYLMPDLSGRPS